MAHIFITRPIPGDAAAQLQAAGHTVVMNTENRPLSHEEFISELKKASYDGVLCLLHDQINAEVFTAAPSVKIFSNYAVGYNNIDMAEARKRGITITNTPCDSVNESVAEHTWAMTLSLLSRITEGDRFVRAGGYHGWDPNLLPGLDLKGMTLGVVGAGRIGTFVIEKAVKGFGMKVVYFDMVQNSHIEQEFGAVRASSVEALLSTSDVVTLHVFLSDETRHLINAERLSRMKPTAVLINTARGPVIDEAALAEALSTQRIRGAAIDVFEDEPNINPKLLSLQNVILTPHIASATERARSEMTTLAVGGLVDFFSGKLPVHIVR